MSTVETLRHGLIALWEEALGHKKGTKKRKHTLEQLKVALQVFGDACEDEGNPEMHMARALPTWHWEQGLTRDEYYFYATVPPGHPKAYHGDTDIGEEPILHNGKPLRVAHNATRLLFFEPGTLRMPHDHFLGLRWHKRRSGVTTSYPAYGLEKHQPFPDSEAGPLGLLAIFVPGATSVSQWTMLTTTCERSNEQ
jgi:hypothetical protein